MLTLDQFRATRREVASIGDEPGISDECLQGRPGFVYVETLYIETGDWLGKRYCLTIGNESGVGNDLEAYERELYEFACDEGYCDECDDAHPADRANYIHND